MLTSNDLRLKHHYQAMLTVQLQLLKHQIQIPEYRNFKYHHNYRLPLGLDLCPLTGPYAARKVHEDHVLRSTVHMRLRINLLSRCILRRQGTRA
jgi:hypothetical protein